MEERQGKEANTQPSLFDQPSDIPHSGKLSDEMREQHPTGEFDESSLERPYQEGHFEGVEDASTLPENMPPVDRTVKPPRKNRDDIALRRHQEESADSEEPWYKTKAAKIGGLVAGGITVLTFGMAIGASGGEEDEVSTQPIETTEPEAITTTTTTINEFQVRDEDYRPEGERDDTYEPVPAIGDTADEVLGKIFQNWERANEQINTSYLTFVFYDTSSPGPMSIKTDIENLENNYPVTISYEILEETKIGDSWIMRIMREFDAPPIFDGEPQERTMTLKQKEFYKYDKATDTTESYMAWTILEDAAAENQN